MSGTTTRPMTPRQVERLHADLRQRDELLRRRAEHSTAVLEIELGLSRVTIWKIDTGTLNDCPRGGTSPRAIQEVKRRKAIWHAIDRQLQPYTESAIRQRHRISETTFLRHIQAVRTESAGREQEAA